MNGLALSELGRVLYYSKRCHCTHEMETAGLVYTSLKCLQLMACYNHRFKDHSERQGVFESVVALFGTVT